MRSDIAIILIARGARSARAIIAARKTFFKLKPTFGVRLWSNDGHIGPRRRCDALPRSRLIVTVPQLRSSAAEGFAGREWPELAVAGRSKGADRSDQSDHESAGDKRGYDPVLNFDSPFFPRRLLGFGLDHWVHYAKTPYVGQNNRSSRIRLRLKPKVTLFHLFRGHPAQRGGGGIKQDVRKVE